MKTYKTKNLIDGHKIKPELKDKKLLAINSKLVDKEVIEIIVRTTGEKLILNPSVHKSVEKIKFRDKYGRGDYSLLYFIAADLVDRQLNLL